MSVKKAPNNEIKSRRSKPRKLPKETGLRDESGRLNPRRGVSAFPAPKALLVGASAQGKARYYGQTCKLLQPIMGGGWNELVYDKNTQRNSTIHHPDFPLALDGEFGMYQGVRTLPAPGGKAAEVAVIKFAHCVGLLPDDGTWFEVID